MPRGVYQDHSFGHWGSSPPGAWPQLVTQEVCCPEMWGTGERQFLEMFPLGLARLQDLCYVWGCLLPRLLEGHLAPFLS